MKAAIWPEMVAPYGIVYGPALILAISYLLFMAGVCCSLCVTSQLLALCLLAATVTACIFTMAMNEFLWQYVALAPAVSDLEIVGGYDRPTGSTHLPDSTLARSGVDPRAAFLGCNRALGTGLAVRA